MRHHRMTVRKGEAWGRTGPAPAGLVEVRSDAELHELVNDRRRAGAPIPPVGLLGGDLCRTLGGTGRPERLRSDARLHRRGRPRLRRSSTVASPGSSPHARRPAVVVARLDSSRS